MADRHSVLTLLAVAISLQTGARGAADKEAEGLRTESASQGAAARSDGPGNDPVGYVNQEGSY